MITRRCLPRFQLQNRTEPVVLKTLKGGQKGESGSHVTLSAPCKHVAWRHLRSGPLVSIGRAANWRCKGGTGVCMIADGLLYGVRANYRMGSGRSAQTGEPRRGPPWRPSKGLPSTRLGVLACRIKSYQSTRSARIGQEGWPDSTGAPGLPRWCQATPSTRFLAADSHPPHRCPDLTQWRKAVVCAQKVLEAPVGRRTIGPLCAHC
jgi:hypothetical protein